MADINTHKSHLTVRELKYFKELLIKKRMEAEEKLEKFRSLQENLDEAEEADYSSLTHHLGDVGSDEQETEMNYLQIEQTLEYINHIDDALDRIENGTYGICHATGKPIAIERLQIVPHTRYSIEAKKQGIAKDT